MEICLLVRYEDHKFSDWMYHVIVLWRCGCATNLAHISINLIKLCNGKLLLQIYKTVYINMTTLYGNDDFTILRNMSTSQSTQSTQDTATTSFISTSSNFEISELKKYRHYWWKTGKLHSKARWEEAT